ncbi:hypothetical protein ACFXI8_13720 [Streptomyces niveus]|uniref:hypothetical protein n=1 Tax=Streptomyces niveus TaxID=193462 RepID=UPI0036A532E4
MLTELASPSVCAARQDYVDWSHFSRSMPRTGSTRPRSGLFPDQPPTKGGTYYRFTRSAWVQLLYHQQTKNLLVSYSPKKLGFF